MEALFDLEDVGLEVTPTIAMERGEQVIHQCAWCGAVVVWMHGGYRTELKDCPACDRNQGWWEQRLPIQFEVLPDALSSHVPSERRPR